MIQVYSEKISSRFSYVTHVLFEAIGKQPLRITDKAEELDPRFAVLWYAKTEPDRPAIHIFPHSILDQPLEAGIIEENPVEWNQLPIFCCTTKGGIPFDVFAASFWLLSRWEEYLPHAKDLHGRFPAHASYLYKHGLIERPLIDEWVKELLVLIEEKWPKTVINARKFEHHLTVDIDMPYAYRSKPFVNQLGGSLKDLAQLKFSRLIDRISTITGSRKDPFDTFEIFTEVSSRYQDRLTFFIHVGDRTQFDPYTPDTNEFKDLIYRLSKESSIGLHPSYSSHSNQNKLKEELDRLQQLVEVSIENSRFHYVKFNLPDSFHKLSELGITDEYSMGYPETPGFRAGTCTPFTFYDLESDKKLSLVIHPFAFMDATFIQYHKQEPADAMKHMISIVDRVKQVKGTLNTVWHNHSFSKLAGDPNWEKVLLEFMSNIHTK